MRGGSISRPSSTWFPVNNDNIDPLIKICEITSAYKGETLKVESCAVRGREGGLQAGRNLAISIGHALENRSGIIGGLFTARTENPEFYPRKFWYRLLEILSADMDKAIDAGREAGKSRPAIEHLYEIKNNLFYIEQAVKKALGEKEEKVTPWFYEIQSFEGLDELDAISHNGHHDLEDKFSIVEPNSVFMYILTAYIFKNCSFASFEKQLKNHIPPEHYEANQGTYRKHLIWFRDNVEIHAKTALEQYLNKNCRQDPCPFRDLEIQTAIEDCSRDRKGCGINDMGAISPYPYWFAVLTQIRRKRSVIQQSIINGLDAHLHANDHESRLNALTEYVNSLVQ